MNVHIKKLSIDLLDDWLDFFDHVGFTDNDEWSGCYCMCYHWNEKLNRKKEWNCSKEDAPYNRKCAVDFIKRGRMQGYLAYEDDKVVGWCNANDKEAYDNVNFSLPVNDSDKNNKVKSIVCFCISPEKRGRGIASLLLERVCADAVTDQYDVIEAYPFLDDSNNAYHGPQSMYEKSGFQACGYANDCTVLRKLL